MSPRQGGPRYTPDTQQQGQSPDQPVSHDDSPPYQYGRKTWSGGGFSGSGSATPERTMAFSTTILDSIIPFVYGERKVSGLVAGMDDYTGQLRPLAFIFAFGEQDSITDLRVNGELATGLSWISGITYRYGTGAETIPTGFTQFGTNADWAKYAYVCFWINTLDADVPGSLDVTAVLGGQHVYDFRTTTTDVYANPVLIAYDIQTNANWKGLASTRIDVDQWEPVADWCDDVMGDATARFEFNGVVYHRDPEAAVDEVLGHCFASMYFGADGKLRLWSEMDPPAITGTWTASGVNVSEDSAAGAASTELEAGDIVYVHKSPRVVASVTDDDNFVLTTSATGTSVTVRKTSGVYIREENWVRVPTGRNIAPGSIPDVVIVNHTQSGDWGSHQFPAPGDVTGDKRLEISASGCTNASQAARMSATEKNLKVYQPFMWNNGVTDGTGAGLEPGDVAFFDDDVLTMQAVRILPPVVWLTNGHISIDCREYDPNANSISTEPDDTPPSVDPGWVTDDPDAPTAATQTFGEAGEWDTASILPDPDDLTTTQGWVNSGGITSVYSAPNDYTTFTSDGDCNADYSPTLSGAGLVLVTGLAKTSDADWYIQYFSNSRTIGVVSVTSDDEWHRFSMVVDAEDVSDSVRVRSIGDNLDTCIVRRLRCVEWSFDPTLSLYERWDWTEHASAGSSVDLYQMVDVTNNSILIDQTPQGAVALEHVMLTLGVSGQTTQWGSGATVEATMCAVGPNGGAVAFPTPTQAIEARAGTIIVDPSGFTGTLGSGDTDLATALATIDDISTSFKTTSQVMNGSKASVADNTSTTIVTFTMPTGPSDLAAKLAFVGRSTDATDTTKVIIEGWLMAVRSSAGTVTAEWVKTFNDDKATGSVTFGTNVVAANVATADVEMKVTLDSTLNQTWDVAWTALLSDDVTVTEA